jgi:hypothetical protein
MAHSITEAQVRAYSANVAAEYQQSESKLRGTVVEETMKGKLHFFDRVSPTAAVKKTVRHAATPLVETIHARRAAVMADYEWADLLDPQDKLRIIIEPGSAYVTNAVKALNRSYDDEVIAAFTATVLSGEDGTSSVAFGDTGEAAGDEDFTGAAITVQNLTTLKLDLDMRDVPASDRFIIADPNVFEQLLKQTSTPNVASSDYNTVRALVNGEIDTFLGFRFIMSTRLPLVAGDATRVYGFAWHKDAMGIALGTGIETNVSVRDDLSYATQFYAKMTMGAIRKLPGGVVRFRIDKDN